MFSDVFADEVRRADKNELDGEDVLSDTRRIAKSRFVPDSFWVDEDQRLVFVLKTINTHDVDDFKAQRISNCFWLLDYAKYQLVVVLFYEATQQTMVAWDLMLLDARAEKLQTRKSPYRDALFRTITTPLLVGGVA